MFEYDFNAESIIQKIIVNKQSLQIYCNPYKVNIFQEHKTMLSSKFIVHQMVNNCFSITNLITSVDIFNEVIDCIADDVIPKEDKDSLKTQFAHYYEANLAKFGNKKNSSYVVQPIDQQETPQNNNRSILNCLSRLFCCCNSRKPENLTINQEQGNTYQPLK